MNLYKTLMVAALMLLCTASLAQNNPQKQNKPIRLSLKGQIQGADTGDTLLFTPITVKYVLEPELSFKVPLNKNGEFSYRGKVDDVRFYAVTLLSKREQRSVKDFSRIYAPGLLDDSKITITGERDQMPYLIFSGGPYTPELVESQKIDNASSMNRDVFAQKMNKAYAEGDTILGQKYAKEFNNHYALESTITARAAKDSIEKEYMRTHNNDLVAFEACTAYSRLSAQEMFAHYEKLSPSAKNGYHGRELLRIATTLKNLEVGGSAPDFTLQTPQGDSVRLNDLKGKYVLIYHYGMCPGSLQLEPYITEFYKEHKDRLEVIGYTSWRDQIKEIAENLEKSGGATTEIGGVTIDIAASTKSMTAHPWKWDVNSQDGNNATLSDEYQFGGLPYMVFISPQGKMIARGYGEVYRVVMETIKE